MIEWDQLVGPTQQDAGRLDLPKTGTYCPGCPGSKDMQKSSPGQQESINHAGFRPVVPAVPLVPAKKDREGLSDLSTIAPGGDGASDSICAANPVNMVAALLCIAWCKRNAKSKRETLGLLLDLGNMQQADQVRHWHNECLAAGIKPWHVLYQESGYKGEDCGMCKHLESLNDTVQGTRRRYFWKCSLGHPILEYGRYTERILLAPPECSSWDRWYPSAQR